MFCPNCGKELPDGSVFCTNCGASLAQQQSQQSQQAYQQPQQQAYQQPQQPYQQPQQAYQPYQQNPYQYPYSPTIVVKQSIRGRGLGIASMVLGIIASLEGILMLIYSILYFADPRTFYDAFGDYSSYSYGGYSYYATYSVSEGFYACAITGIILAVIGLGLGIGSIVHYRKGQSIVGLILNGLTLATCIVAICII